MLRSNDLLRPCLRMLRRLTGARAVSLYLPAGEGGSPEPMLIQEGRASVAELADLPAAEQLARKLESRKPVDGQTPWLQSFDSSSEAGRIVRVSAPESLLTRLHASETDSGEDAPARRRSDDPRRKTPPGAVWIGFHMAANHRLEWPAELSEPQAADSWWSWALALSATVAWHAQHLGAVLGDPVSGLPGRTQFQASLLQAMERTRAKRRSLTLVLINPTDFVVVNENFGREAGDAVIREIAHRLSAAMRSSDLVGRYGGAVFSLGLLDTDADVGRLVAEKLRRKLIEGAYLRGTVRLGFDCGLATYEPQGQRDAAVTPLELIRRADRALNLAKQSPESPVVVWQGDPETEEVATLDRLSGIFTANLAKDYRNMLFLWDTVNIVSKTSDFEALAARVVDRLHATFKTERVALYGWSEDEGFRRLGGGKQEEPGAPLEPGAGRRQLLERARRRGDAVETSLPGPDEGAGRFCCAVPLLARRRCLGCLYVEGHEDSKTFDRSDLIFLKALAGQLAVTLDRSLLAAQERASQERERRRLRSELQDLRQALQESRLVYRSPEMEAVVSLLRRLAPTDATLLITGESGTGKELLARTAHELSPRRKKPFVVVDCGAIAAPLIERELFGHEKGAFTSAEKRGLGRLAEADGGSIILDEIGELPLEVQTRFLRFAQEKQFTPVGGTRPREVDVRLIAVTNRDLEREVAAGRFRADLYYRLNVAPLHVPPLRERPDDVVFLARHFLKKFSVQYQKGVRRFDPVAEAQLVQHPWPGNVRELQNRVMRAVILCEGEEIGARDLEIEAAAPPLAAASASGRRVAPPPAGLDPRAAELREATHDPAPESTEPASWDALRFALGKLIEAATAEEAPVPLGRWLSEDLVLEAYDAAGGVSKRGAALLGIPATTFRRKLRKAQTRARAGLSPRPASWEPVRPLLSGLVRTTSGAPAEDSEDLLERARDLLLELILARLPKDAGTAAALMGVTEPTYRTWVARIFPGE